jgi:erythrin-vacuolar iron transport family protein
MMSRVRNAADHDPRPAARDLEELDPVFPPAFFLAPQDIQSLSGVLRVPGDEAKPVLHGGQGRRLDMNPEHAAKPQVFADALVHHLLPHASAAAVDCMGPGRKILIAEHTPNTDHFEPLGFVGVHQELIAHFSIVVPGKLMADTMAKRFKDLTEREILALAISLEEEDARVYGDFADGLREQYPATAKVFEEMQAEESSHRASLIEMYQKRFGNHIPLIRRHDVSGFVHRRPLWLVRPLGIKAVRRQTEVMELETRRFYERALNQTTDADIRKLLGDLAETERRHYATAESLEQEHVPQKVGKEEDEAQRRLFALQVIQPGLAGLMDGSVSTLAPVFAAAFATKNSSDAFLVGLAASIGAGISMGFAEALSDDGSLTGRGRPLIRGVICGAMTAAGGLGHTFPFLAKDFSFATSVAVLVVVVELAIISYVRHRYMDTPFLAAAFQVMVGGALVFLTGILIGNS